MAYRSRSYSRPFFSPDWFPPGVKWLLIVNVGIFLILFFSGMAGAPVRWYTDLSLIPAMVVQVGALWQVFTYGFLHAGPQHIFWNALSLWMFGMMLERAWGTRRFIQFYFVCLVGAAIFTVIFSYLFFDPRAPYIGMSGAVFGLLVAFGFVFKDQTVMFTFVFPMKAQYMAMLLGALWFFMTLDTHGGFLPHLGGMVTAFVYMMYAGNKVVPSLELLTTLRQRYKQWKIERARKKFQVYMRKNDPDRDRWVN